MNQEPMKSVHEDRGLVERILSGSVEAWHGFIDAYTPLLFGAIRRYLPKASEDERRSLYVQVLEGLYTGKLADYRGESRLSTWLFLFVRSRCLDSLRSRNGRHGLPEGMRKLSDLDREVYRLYYIWGCGVEEICTRLFAGGRRIGVTELADSLERIDQRLSERSRRRVAFELHARSIGCASGRLLDYVHHLRIEQEGQAKASSPDQGLLQCEARQTLEMVQEFVERLPDLEKKVIALRYYHGYTARMTAAHLDLAGERRVYTVEQRAIRRLRRMFRA